MRACFCSCAAVFLVALLALVGIRAANALPVSYTLNLNPGTSNGQDVTDVMILESDGGLFNIDYPYSLGASGVSVLTHDVPFSPTSSLIVGLTEGAEKTQIVMFTGDEFAQSAAGLPFSESFSTTRHSELINHMTLAQAGDQAELAWFADTFWPTDGVAAAFPTGGSFTALEFTSGTVIGGDVSSEGNWVITGQEFIPSDDPDAHFSLPTIAIDEVATDTGPFDLEVTVDFSSTCCDAVIAIDKNVLNDSGVDWTDFHWQLGYGLGANFEPSTSSDGLDFATDPEPLDESGAFSDVEVETDDLWLFGALPEGETTTIWASLRVPRELADANNMVTFTIRQHASFVPEPTSCLLVLWAIFVCGLGCRSR